MPREAAVAAALFAACACWAQPTPDTFPGTMGKPADEAEWKETEVPSPPPLRTSGLVGIDAGGSSQLQFGVDPQSVQVGDDKVVRYVFVATSRSGAVNAAYEGLRCDRGEYRVYARASGQGWRPVDTEWKSLFEGFEAQHVRAIAKGGACAGRTPNRNAQQIVQDLRAPAGRKFGGSNAP